VAAPEALALDAPAPVLGAPDVVVDEDKGSEDMARERRRGRRLRSLPTRDTCPQDMHLRIYAILTIHTRLCPGMPVRNLRVASKETVLRFPTPDPTTVPLVRSLHHNHHRAVEGVSGHYDLSVTAMVGVICAR
jgi:hypothetical protein